MALSRGARWVVECAAGSRLPFVILPWPLLEFLLLLVPLLRASNTSGALPAPLLLVPALVQAQAVPMAERPGARLSWSLVGGAWLAWASRPGLRSTPSSVVMRSGYSCLPKTAT